MSLHRLLTLLIVVVTGVAIGWSGKTRAQLVVNVTTTVEVLAFSHDGSFALVRERNDTAFSTSARFMLVDATGVTETLPLTERARVGGAADGVSAATCDATFRRLEGLSKQLAGLSVVGLCSHPQRPLVRATQQPRAVVGDAELGRLHAKLGFVGQTFISPRHRFAIVIGQDFNGNTRIVTTPLPSSAPLVP